MLAMKNNHVQTNYETRNDKFRIEYCQWKKG